MVRKATGQEVLEKAKECLVQAQTVEELRQAQSVLLPLTFGLSLKQTAQAIGVSPGWACQLRRRFLKDGGFGNRPSRGGRRRENLTREQEAEFLAPFLEKAQSGGMLIVTEIKIALEKRLERRVALASVYNLLHRHGWRCQEEKMMSDFQDFICPLFSERLCPGSP